MKITKLSILIDGIVDHSLTKPINIYDIMLKKMKVESSIEVSIVLKKFDIYVPNQIGSDENDRDY